MKRSHLWILISIVVLAVVVATVLIFALPSSDSGEEEAEPARDTVAEESTGEQPEVNQDQDGGQGTGETPAETDNGSQELVVNFPDPAADGGEKTEENQLGEEQGDICGAWIIDMTGADYGLTNLHISLMGDGSITAPDDYKNVFEVTQSKYSWDSGSPDFTASIQVTLKMGSNQTTIPISIELTGRVSEPPAEIEGDFTATPQVEAFAPYGQQGTFKMYR